MLLGVSPNRLPLFGNGVCIVYDLCSICNYLCKVHDDLYAK